jgi:hypothetical protein
VRIYRRVIAVVDGQNCCADALRVRDTFEQSSGAAVSATTNNVATRHRLQPVEPDGKMRRRVRRWRITNKCRDSPGL